MARNIELYSALLAGLLSFVSPCVLPLVPPYLCYLAGVSLDQLTDDGDVIDVRNGRGCKSGFSSTRFYLFLVSQPYLSAWVPPHRQSGLLYVNIKMYSAQLPGWPSF